jgi:hypothetical protein
MPLDVNLLYGEMVASWIAHLAIPVGAGMLIGVMPYMMPTTKVLALIALSMLFSFVCQFIFLVVLQTNTCGGMKDYGGVAMGAMLCAAITGAMVAIPGFVEPMRLVISQLFGDHKTLLTPELARMNNLITKTSQDVLQASLGSPVPTAPASVQQGGAAITQDEYDVQTFQEITTGASYWAAFAGAYGVGLGSLMATKCQSTS